MGKNTTKKLMSNKKQTAVDFLEEQILLTSPSVYKLMKEANAFNHAKKIHEEQMIDFHVSVMKKGLIEEGDRQWTDCYLPKIREVAEQCYIETYEQ
jgi:hypothetical protein